MPFRPTLNIFLVPLTRPCLTGMGQSVGKLFYFTSQIRYPLIFIVNSPTLGNNIKYTNNLQLRIFFKNNIVYIGQFFKLGSFFQGRSGKGKQIKFYFRPQLAIK